jgi:hypothetical protein
LIFAACSNTIFVVNYNNRKFSIISKLVDVVSDEISHMKFINNYIYVTTPANSELVRVSFPKLLSDSRRKSVVGGFDMQFIQNLNKHKIIKYTLESKSIALPIRTCELDEHEFRQQLPVLQDRWFIACHSSPK